MVISLIHLNLPLIYVRKVRVFILVLITPLFLSIFIIVIVGSITAIYVIITFIIVLNKLINHIPYSILTNISML